MFLFITSFSTAERVLAKMGLALAGMWRIVARFSLKTSSKVKVNAPLLLFKELGPELYIYYNYIYI